MKEYYVYMLLCHDGSYYTGVTNDYRERLKQHNIGLNQSCYTFSRRPVELAYLGVFGDITNAIAWEKRVKKWSRKKKEALIQGNYGVLPQYACNAMSRRILMIHDHTTAMVRTVMVSTVEP